MPIDKRVERSKSLFLLCFAFHNDIYFFSYVLYFLGL